MVEITFEPVKKIIIHGVQEYTFDELIQEFSATAEIGGPTIHSWAWADGVALNPSYHPVDSGRFNKDYLEGGTLHIHQVTFALKEKFEKQVIKGNVTVNFLDESEKAEMSDLAKKLKEQSKHKTSSQ